MIIEPTFLTHWKTTLLKQLLNDDKAALYVIALWSYCQTSRKPTLDIPHAAIASICGYANSAEALIEALVECRFLDKDGDTLTVHQWSEYNGKLVANWENGMKGGRPKAGTTQRKPTVNPTETQDGFGKPTFNRLDKTGEEETGGEIPPLVSREEANREPAGGDEPLSETTRRLNAIFSRKSTTRWSERELKTLQKIGPIPEEDLQLIESYYASRIPGDRDFRRHDLQTLLNNWPGEVDRARKHRSVQTGETAIRGSSWDALSTKYKGENQP